MILIATVTALLALFVGRYAGRRGLIAASIVVFLGSAVILAGQYEGLTYVLFLVLNVAIFEILAVSMMLFFPSER
jgi:hypothetical protein